MIGDDRMIDEKQCLKNYIREKGMRYTKQRELILEKFLRKEGHLGAQEMFVELHKKYPNIGQSTVYRTVNLLKEASLAREVNISGKRRHFEHEYDHPHHDHLVCIKCGKMIEFCEPKIEELQNKIFKKYGFIPKDHKMEIYGYCNKCKNPKLQIRNPK